MDVSGLCALRPRELISTFPSPFNKTTMREKSTYIEIPSFEIRQPQVLPLFCPFFCVVCVCVRALAVGQLDLNLAVHVAEEVDICWKRSKVRKGARNTSLQDSNPQVGWSRFLSSTSKLLNSISKKGSI